MSSCDIKQLSALLKLVSDNSRLQLLCILQKGEHCVCELMELVKLSQSLISHHLKDLKDFDLVVDRKDGKWSYYSLTTKGQEITNLIFKIKV
jgi:ArsR family transcriptional regulator